VDLCVVGGGLSGLCAALAAARNGARVVLVQDRPVLGGNSSSEIRMWIGGAKGKNNRESGIIEQLLLENFRRNELGNWRYWDLILYEAARLQDGLELLLNCTCNELTMDGARIAKVRAWQMTCETFHEIRATLFADCTGDGILAPLSGAEFRVGREAAGEFGEDIEPEEADCKTMGLSLLPQPREHPFPVGFEPPSWARKLTDADLPHRGRQVSRQNFWWIELGGLADSIHDAEEIRDELLAYLLGIWDQAKNRDELDLDNWSLDWFGMLPGKRESRRYVGDHILTQNDVRAEGRFDDVVAYGGWSMDDHHPAGLAYKGEPTIFHPAPSPYGIPYRCLYSRNVENLFCGGRAISVTHAALSSTRVMATCAVIGQAIGTAAAIAAAQGATPRQVGREHLDRLQATLMDDDAYLPGKRRRPHPLTEEAELTASSGNPEPLRNGMDRPVGENYNGWQGSCGDWVQLAWPEPVEIGQVRLVFDSNCSRGDTRTNLPCAYPMDPRRLKVPAQLVRSFCLQALSVDGLWQDLYADADNYQRFRRIELKAETRALRLTCQTTWGDEKVKLFAIDVG
jgi:hypothetical protein